MTDGELEIRPAAPSDPDACQILRAFFEEVVSRYLHRPARPEEVDAAMAEAPSHDLDGPTGVLLVACRGATAVGCAGLRYRPGGSAEVTRVFVAREERRKSIGSKLMRELELVARQQGTVRLQLDTRNDLVESHQLYIRCGFEEVPAFKVGRYSERWFAKDLLR